MGCSHFALEIIRDRRLLLNISKRFDSEEGTGKQQLLLVNVPAKNQTLTLKA